MILAHHCIFSMYGFWLPNDPRGSGSDYIAAWELFRYGNATKTDSRRSVASVSHDVQLRRAAKQALKFPPVEVSGVQAVTIVHGFAQACAEAAYRIHACAVLPEHVHLVIGVHERRIRQVAGHMKSRATHLLKTNGQWYDDNRPLWGEHGWNVYLNDETAVRRAIRYVNDNPLKEGKRAQKWSVVSPFELAVATRIARGPRRPVPKLGGAALKSAEAARHKRSRPKGDEF